MRLSEGFHAVAVALQEEATQLSHADIRARLCDALNDIGAQDHQYYYVVDVFGDDESGDLIYSCGGDTMKAPYELSTVNGKAVASIDTDQAVDVMPRTIYEEEADEADHYASLEAALVKDKLYTALPLYERFISKSERDAADTADFAGKGKSFPILKPGDVMAAVRSMGRAGSENKSTSALKASIIRIAKKKGWSKYLPAKWRDDAGTSDASEGRRASGVVAGGPVKLTEAATTLDPIVLKEAKADYEIKLIAPGKGSSAFYPAEVLKRDGPKVFGAGTHVYLNHPTAAEEAARPEGDVSNLAGVLTTAAVYREQHIKGPGLYARMKVFQDHAQVVEEKAAHVGMSIRASGKAESGRMKEGLPILSELTSAESVDIVTRAGAGGMIFSEAARPAAGVETTTTEGVTDMDLKEVQKLIDTSISAAVQPYKERALRGDAVVLATKALAEVALHESAKQMAIDNVINQALPVTEAGALDEKVFTERLNAEVKRVGAVLGAATGAGRVIGMGAPVVDAKEAEARAKADKKAAKEARKESRAVFESLGLTEDAAKYAARGRVA